MASTKVPIELSSTPGIVDNSNATAITIDSSENVGIGATSPGRKLEVHSSATNAEGFRVLQTTAGRTSGGALGLFYDDQAGTTQPTLQVIQNGTGDIFQLFDAASQVLTVKDGGNVGIGVVPSSTQTLTTQITNGLSLFGNNTTPYGFISNNHVWASGTGDTWLVSGYGASYYKQYNSEHIWATAPSGTAGSALSFSERMRIDSSGNVGIGTSSPSCKLAVTTSSSGSVVSDIRNSNSGGYGIYLAAASGSAYALAVDSYNNLRRLTVQGNGAIFMPALSYASASTDLNYNTSTGEVFVVTSSRRYKSNIADLDIDISKILSLRPVSYTDNNGGTNAVGLIAEEVHEEIPQLVNYKEIEGYDEIQPDSVKYSTLSVYLLKAIQEQQVLIEQLQAEVALLKGE